MNITEKDIKTIWRSPIIWLLLAVVSFMSAWLFWQMIDRYASLQTSLINLPNPPTITQSLWLPFILTLAKFLMLLVAYTAGVSMAQERSQHTMWYLLINRQQTITVVTAKFKAQLMIMGFVLLLCLITAFLLATGGAVNWLQIMAGILGLLLFVTWLIALGLLVSSYCQSSGTAVLMNVVLFIFLWMLGGDVISQDYGLNWLILASPAHHLRWFGAGEIGISSLCYFVLGAVIFIGLTARKLEQLRRVL